MSQDDKHENAAAAENNAQAPRVISEQERAEFENNKKIVLEILSGLAPEDSLFLTFRVEYADETRKGTNISFVRNYTHEKSVMHLGTAAIDLFEGDCAHAAILLSKAAIAAAAIGGAKALDEDAKNGATEEKSKE